MRRPPGPEFARELPRFVAYIRGFFNAAGNAEHISHGLPANSVNTIAVNDNEDGDEFDGDDELIRETPEVIAQRVRQFAAIKQLLTAAEPGTS